MKLLNKTQSGRSMVEMLGVLAIIGVLSVGGIAGYSKAMFKHKMNQTLDILSHALNRLVELDGLNWGNASIGGNEDAVKYGIIPDCEIDSGPAGGCKLPLNASINYDLVKDPDHNKIFAKVYINIYDNHQEACTTILSSNLHEIYPDDWWNSLNGESNMPPGNIAVESEMVYTKYPMPEKPELNTINASTISNACQKCEPNIFGYCTISYGIRTL